MRLFPPRRSQYKVGFILAGGNHGKIYLLAAVAATIMKVRAIGIMRPPTEARLLGRALQRDDAIQP